MKKSDESILYENRRIAQLQQIGTMQTANYIVPRSYYYQLSYADDFMALMLLTIDQLKTRCRDMVRTLSKDKSVFKQGVKKLCSDLYKRNNSLDTGICAEVESALTTNMTLDELSGFGLMASHIDDVICKDFKKLSDEVLEEVVKVKANNKELLSCVLSVHLFGLIASHILDRCLEKSKGSRYYLCIAPTSSEARNRGYKLDGRDVQRMSNVTLKLVNEIVKGQTFSIPYTESIEDDIATICNKMCDVDNVYTACLEAGIQVGKHSAEDLTRLVEELKSEKE